MIKLKIISSTFFKLLVGFIFITTSSNLFSQSDLDSMLNIQFESRDTNMFHNNTKIIIELFKKDLKLSRTYIDDQIKLADEIGDPSLIAYAANINAVYYSNISEYKKAKSLFEDVISQYQKLGNLERVSAILNNIAICNQNLGQLDLALENQMKSLRIKDSLGVAPEAIAASYWNISNIFWEIKDVEQSNAYIYKAMKIYDELGDEDSYISVKDLLTSNLRTDFDSIPKAIEIMQECMAYYEKHGQLNNLAGIYEGLGNASVQLDKFDEAEVWFLKALKIAENEGEKRFPGILYRRLGNIYRIKGKYNKALAYAQRALENSQSLELKKKEINDHLTLSEIYDEMGDYNKAFRSYQRYHEMNDSILGNEKALAIEELEKKYQTEKKEQEIVILQEQKKSDKLRQLALLLALASLFISLIALWIYFSQRAKRSKVEKAKLDQEISFTNKALESKKQELTVFALQLAQKNELLENLKTDIESINKNANDGKSLQSLINTIQFNQNDEEVWESFKTRFEQVHVGFNKRILEKYPSVTTNDLRLISLIKMNLSSKEIANILNITPAGIKKARYRLRKKLSLDNEEKLDNLILLF